MKKNLKAEVLAIITFAAMISGGCSNNKIKEETVKGGYVEQKLELSNDIESVSEFYKLNGKIVAYDQNNLTLVSFSEENSSLEDEDFEICAINDSTRLIKSINDSSHSFEYIIIQNDKEIKTDIANTQHMIAADFSSDGRLFAIVDNQFVEIDTTSGKQRNIETVGYLITAFDVVKDNVYYSDEKGLHIYDYKKGASVETPDVLNNIFKLEESENNSPNMPYKICAGDENSILIGCSSGIFRYVMNESHTEQIIDGTRCSIGNKLKKFTSLEFCDDNSIIVGFDNGEIYKYVYDPDYTNQITSTLSIYSLDNNDELKQMINTFASSRPDVRVDYKVGHRNGMTYQDALKEFSVLMLSNDAPDIIMFEGMDIQNLIDKNMLLDLSKNENEWNKDNNLLDNVAKWNENEKGLYCVTTRFRIPAVSAEKKALEKINSFSDYVDYMEVCKKNKSDSFIISTCLSMNEVPHIGFDCVGNSLINNKKVDKAKVEKFFYDCYRYGKCQYDIQTVWTDAYFPVGMGEYSFASAFCNNLANENTAAIGTINTFEKDLNFVTSLDSSANNFNIDYKFGISENDGLFISNCTLGIANKSKNQKEAIAFLASALDSEKQKTTCGNGFPVNKDTLEWYYSKKNQKANYDDYKRILNFENDDVDRVKVEYMDDTEVSKFKSYINSLKAPLEMDYAVMEIFDNNALKCIKDELTPAEAADEVERQLDLKMKE